MKRRRGKLPTDEAQPLKSQRTHSHGIFCQDVLYFVAFGLGKLHKRILETRVRDHDGNVVSTFEAAKVTHAITDLEYDLAIRELPDGWDADGAVLISTSWVTECIKLQHRLSSQPFIVEKQYQLQSLVEKSSQSSLKRTQSNGSDTGTTPERRLSRSTSDVTPLARTPSDIAADSVALDVPPTAHVAKVESNELNTTARLPLMPWLLLPASDGMKHSREDTSEDEAESDGELGGELNWLRYGTTSDSEDSSSESETDTVHRPLRCVHSGQRRSGKTASTADVKVDDDWLQIPAGRPLKRAESGASSCLVGPTALVKTPEAQTKPFPIARNRAQYFACQKKPLDETADSNVNKELTDILEDMEKLEKNSGEHWRAMAYRKAITALRRHPHPIRSADDARRLKGIGERIAKKIGEIVDTGGLKRLQDASESEFQQTLLLFSDIWGVGGETAKKWYAMGHRSLEDLRQSSGLLNAQQLIGLKHFEAFKKRIPREEVFLLGEVVRSALQQVDRNLQMEICGSYRRGAATCGDVDILISNKKGEELDDVLEESLNILHKEGFLTDDLSRGGRHSSKYMGVCCLPPPTGSGVHRRIDLQTIPLDEWPCALLYFTGSAHLNRSMRLWARKNGFSLSEKALVPRHNVPKGPVNYRKSNPETDELKGEPIPVKTERDIFDALGLEYKEPEERSL